MEREARQVILLVQISLNSGLEIRNYGETQEDNRSRSDSRAIYQDLSDLDIVSTVGRKLRRLQRKIIHTIQTDDSCEVSFKKSFFIDTPPDNANSSWRRLYF